MPGNRQRPRHARCVLTALVSFAAFAGCEDVPSTDDPSVDAKPPPDANADARTPGCYGSSLPCPQRMACEFGCFSSLGCFNDNVSACEAEVDQLGCEGYSACTWTGYLCVLASDTCADQETEDACLEHRQTSAQPCSWRDGCSGTPASCSELFLMEDCAINHGCMWGVES